MLQESNVLSGSFCGFTKVRAGWKQLEKWFLQLYFWICFLEDFVFFLQIGCWLLNCMCKWDTISGMFGCIWIFRNIFTGNLFLAEKVSPASRSCEGPVLQVLRGRFTHIPLRNRWMSWLYHVKQVYILVESDILNWYTLYSEPTSISSLFLVGWNDFVSYLHLDEFMETLADAKNPLFHKTHVRTIPCSYNIKYVTPRILTSFIPKMICYLYL